MATKTKRRRRAINANDLTIAQAEGNVRYGPQVSQISDLYGQAAAQRTSDVNSAKQAANVAVSYANAQRPKTKAEFATGMNVANQAASDVQTAFGGLGAAADPYKAATAREAAGETNRLNEAKLEALQQLTDRATSAKAGRAAAINLARSTYSTNKSQLDSKLSDLLGEQGSYVAGRLATLANQRASDRLGIRKAQIGANAGMNKPITSGAFAGQTPAEVNAMSPQAKQDAIDAFNKAHGGGGSGSGGRATTPQQTSLSNEFSKALRYAQDYAAQDKSKQQRHAAADALLRGSSAGKDMRARVNGKPNPNFNQPYPATPSFGQLPLTLALDMAFDGHVSRQNAQRLHKLGYKVSDVIGAVSFGDWIDTPAGRRWQRAQRAPKTRPRGVGVFAPGQIGGLLG